MGNKEKMREFFAGISKLVDSLQNTRIMRAHSRYSTARGGLLSGGIAYSALFAVGAALTITWTIFMVSLGSDKKLRDAVVTVINEALPGILSTPGTQGLIDPDSLLLSTVITPASLIAASVLVWTSVSVMSALATSVRAMFGITVLAHKPWAQYVRSLGGFIVLATGVFISAVGSILAGAAAAFLTDFLHITAGGAALLVRGLIFLFSFLVDMGIVIFLIRVMSGVRVPARDLWMGSSLAALGTSVLRVVGTTAVGSLSNNPLLASFAALGTLLLWLNLAARIFLQSAAFMANPPRPFQLDSGEQVHAEETPNYVTLSVPRTLEWSHNPLTGNVVPEEENLDEEVEIPHWKGLAAYRARRRMEKAEKRALRAVQKAVKARELYRKGAMEASRKHVVLGEENNRDVAANKEGKRQ